MIGRTLSHYRILDKIGQGGMGEVYRAVDLTLSREVALKLLPDAFVSDPDRLARFHREARVLASLSHPNIAVIHALEEADGIHLLALELVPGPTLADRVAGGALPVHESLRIAGQIADALETAHDKGIIHRDLKPANVKVTPEGKVKVLDFGLAKALTGSDRPADVSLSPTVTSAGTGGGVILGTASYMSPEQARGRDLNRRTDIFSFGCVLYESLTGRRAFPGETASDIMAAVLTAEPDFDALPRDTPPGIRRLLRRCLAKDTSRRLRDIGDARLEIDEALTGAGGDHPVAAGAAAPRASRAWITGVGLLAAALAGAAAVWLMAGQPVAPPAPPTLARVDRLTHDPGLSEWPTWSPDGSLLAFASNRDGNFEVYVRQVAGGQEVNVTNNPGQDFQPAFSPDGKSIAFVSTRSSATGMIKIGSTFGFEFRTFGGNLWVAPALGGRPRRLAENANIPVWHPDGTRVAFVSGPEDHRSIMEAGLEGGVVKPLLATGDSRWEIVRLQYTPDGRSLTFESTDSVVWLMPAGGGEPRPLLTGSSHCWSPEGDRIFYLTRDPLGGTRLSMAPFDKAAGRTGAPITVGLMTGILNHLAVSGDGKRLAVSELEGALNLTRLNLTPAGDAPAGGEETLSGGQVIDRYPSVSPDGNLIAYASDRLGPEEIWIHDLRSGQVERLKLPGEDLGVNLPYWFPDGKSLVVTRFYADGGRSLWQVALDGSSARELQAPLPALQGGPVSADGRKVLFNYRTDKAQTTFELDLATGEKRPLIIFDGDVYDAERSPDGRWIVFLSNASGAIQIWRVPAAGGTPERITTGEDRIRHFSFSPDGRFIYFQPNHQNIYRMPIAGGPAREVTRFDPSGLFIEEPDLSPDGRFLVYCRSNGGSSLWLLSLAAPAGGV